MKKLFLLTFLAFIVSFVSSCAAEKEILANMPKIEGFEIKKIFRLNSNLLAAYTDYSGNRLVFKLNESSATWKRILFKTNESFNY